MGNTWMSDLNSEAIPAVWKLKHPTTGDEKTIPNNRALSSFMARQYWISEGYELDDTIFSEMEIDSDGQL